MKFLTFISFSKGLSDLSTFTTWVQNLCFQDILHTCMPTLLKTDFLDSKSMIWGLFVFFLNCMTNHSVSVKTTVHKCV